MRGSRCPLSATRSLLLAPCCFGQRTADSGADPDQQRPDGIEPVLLRSSRTERLQVPDGGISGQQAVAAVHGGEVPEGKVGRAGPPGRTRRGLTPYVNGWGGGAGGASGGGSNTTYLTPRTARHLLTLRWKPVHPRVQPTRIDRFDEPDLPGSGPSLNLTLALESGTCGRGLLEVYKTGNLVPLSKCRDEPETVLVHSTC